MILIYFIINVFSAIPEYSFDVQSKVLTVGKCTDENSVCEINQADYQKSGPFKTYEVIKIDPGTTSIGDSAFESSSVLTTIYISSWIQSISVPFCRGCSNLKEISLISESQYYESDNFGNLYEKRRKALVRAPPALKINEIAEETAIILEQAFQASKTINLIIPKNVAAINMGAFYDCHIDKIIFESDSCITQLNTNSISTNYIQTIEFPASLKTFSAKSAWNMYSLKNFTFPENSKLISIGESAFFNDPKLEFIKLPNSLQTISASAFASCPSLKSITLSSSLSSLDETAFSGCQLISTIIVPDSNEHYMASKGSLFTKNMDTVIIISPTNSEFEIRDELTVIGQTALQSCPKLTRLIINETHPRFVKHETMLIEKTSMSVLAFAGGISNVVFPSGVKSLGPYCAYGCQSISSISCPSSITTLGDHCFTSSSLTSIDIPGVTSIEDSAFESCSKLIDLKFAETGKLALKQYAFKKCESISTLHFKCSVTSIGYCCFQQCGAKSIIFEADGFTGFSDGSFESTSKLEYVVFPRSLTRIYVSFIRSAIKTLKFPNGCSVEAISANAFSSCINLENITFGSSLQSIAQNAFLGCTNLKSIVFDDSCPLSDLTPTEIFKGCISLKSFNAPANVVKIDPSIFSGCTNLISITATANSRFESVNGILYDVTNGNKVLVVCPPGLSNADITESVSGLGVRCFYECTKLKTVEFPKSALIDSIGDNVFYGCTSLSQLKIPLGVKTISGSAFAKCSKLEVIEFDASSSLHTLGDGVFSDCTNLKQINLEACKKLTSIPLQCFKSCALIEKVRIPLLVEEISESAFEGCTKLSKVTFDSKNALITIEASAYKNCPSLRTIDLPDSLQTIAKYGFSASGLSDTLVLPKGIQTVEAGALSGCHNLRTIIHCGLSKLEEDALDGVDAIVHVVPGYPSAKCLGAVPERDVAPECYIATLEYVRGSIILSSLAQSVVLMEDDEI